MLLAKEERILGGMYQRMYQDCLETEVLAAEPVQLVQILYRGALDAIAAARRALTAGDIATRSRHISKAIGIVNELALSLDHSQQPALCRNLVELYDYVVRRLIDANVQQSEAPLAEAGALLGDLSKAWQQSGAQQQEVESAGIPAHMTDGAAGERLFSYAY